MNDFSFQIFSICKNPGFGHRDFCMKRTVMLSGSGKKSGFTKGKSLAIKKPANSQAENKKTGQCPGLISNGWGTWIRTTEMADSESAALPLGYTPMRLEILHLYQTEKQPRSK